MNEEIREDLPPSRSALKREAKAVEDLAHQLAGLNEAACAELPVGEDLKQEIRRARETGGRGAHKRQVKHLAGLLRRRPQDAEALMLHMEGLHAAQLREQADFHAVEDLRDRLCDPKRFEAAIEETRELFPMLDHRKIMRLSRAVHAGGDKRAFREIFRALRDHR